MHARRSQPLFAVGCSFALLSACSTSQPPPPVMATPAAFVPLGVGAAYLSGDLIGGRKARAAKMRAAKARALGPAEAGTYMAHLEQELRRQTAGIGLDILRVGDGIVIRVPAALTFDPGTSVVKPQTDATLLEISRTVKAQNRTFVDVFGHTDTSGTPKINQLLSERRASAVANYLGTHGVSRARIASRGLGESAPLYTVETDEAQRAANRRVEIRLMPYRS